jgi:EAL domain-containing protein (putative c-di-GMP-specific phosphodiesterase class I)
VVTKSGVRFLTKVKAMGCLFAIGSFGGDIVSFKSLRSVNASFIKINGNIVREIVREPAAAAKVQEITRVCAQHDIATVAEFVETPDVLDMLREMGVNYAQGFGISRPATLSELS